MLPAELTGRERPIAGWRPDSDRRERTVGDSAPPRGEAARRFARRWALPCLLAVAAVVPLGYIGSLACAASRNIVFWDEFDTALEFILRLHAGAGADEILRRLFAINNEHRMFTSRLIFAVSYWTTGTVNFHVIGALGNSFIVGACALLVQAAGAWQRRIRLAVVLALVVFQLENFENFLWSGASIDHFQVVLLAVGAIVALADGRRVTLLGGGLLALLATFTLAHGTMLWPIGGLLLWRQRRWRHLAGWVVLAALVLLAFLHDFEINPGHRMAGFSLEGLGRVGVYWLRLLGGPPALSSPGLAPYFGALLLAAFAYLGATGAARREPVGFYVTGFTVAALALIALGRAEVAGGLLLSRYMILGTLAWSLVLGLILERFSAPPHPWRVLAWCLPVLVGFNVAANRHFAPQAEGYAEARDRAASRFLQYGDDSRGAVRLHPKSGYARLLLERAARQGVYALPPLVFPRAFPAKELSSRLVAQIDEFTVSPRSVYLAGWAMIAGQESRRGQIHVMLRSDQRELIYTTVAVQRPDVAAAYGEPRWRLSGFRFVIPREQLPKENFQVCLLHFAGGQAEYVMTRHWLRLADPTVSQPWISNDS